MDDQTRMLALGFAAPFAASLAIMLIAMPPRREKVMVSGLAHPPRRRMPELVMGLATLLAIGVAGLLSHVAIFDITGDMSATSNGRLRQGIILVPLVAVAPLLFSILFNRWGVGFVTFALTAATAGHVAESILKQDGSGPHKSWIMLLAVVFAASAMALWHIMKTGHRVSSAMILAGTMLGAGAAVMGTGSMNTGMLGLAMGVGMLGLVIACIVSPKAAVAPLGFAAGLTLVASVLSSGHFYAETPRWLAIGIACVPVVGWLAGGVAWWFAPEKPRLIGVVQVVAAAVFALGLVVPGLKQLAAFVLRSA